MQLVLCGYSVSTHHLFTVAVVLQTLRVHVGCESKGHGGESSLIRSQSSCDRFDGEHIVSQNS
jgi:hypothetical protein